MISNNRGGRMRSFLSPTLLFKKKRLLLSLLLWVFDGSNAAYNWKSGSNGNVQWASECGFYGNGIVNKASADTDCGGICAADYNCNYFTWYNGVCYMNAALKPPANHLTGGLCGWVTNKNGGGSGRTTVPANATYWASHSDPDGCQMPGSAGTYTVTYALALGQATSLSNLAFRQGLCGQVLSVNCGNGVVNAVVASKCISGIKCGVDLIAKTWKKATGNQLPGIAQCQVALTNINPIQGSAPLCFYRPNSPTDNLSYASLGVFNTNGRIPSSATLGSIQGNRDSRDNSYFTFNGLNSGLTVTFIFEDGSSSSFSLSSCRSGGDTFIF